MSELELTCDGKGEGCYKAASPQNNDSNAEIGSVDKKKPIQCQEKSKDKRCHSAIIPVGRNDKTKEYAKLNDMVAKSRNAIDLAFIGDSITEWWAIFGKKSWDKYYASRKAINLGIAGDGTQHVLYRLTHGNTDGINPKVTVLMIGTNSMHKNTVKEIEDGIRAIIAKVQEDWSNTRILLLAIFPRGEPNDNLRKKVNEVNEAISSMDDGSKIRYLDISKSFLDDKGVLGGVISSTPTAKATKSGRGRWNPHWSPSLENIIQTQKAALLTTIQILARENVEAVICS